MAGLAKSCTLPVSTSDRHAPGRRPLSGDTPKCCRRIECVRDRLPAARGRSEGGVAGSVPGNRARALEPKRSGADPPGTARPLARIERAAAPGLAVAYADARL